MAAKSKRLCIQLPSAWGEALRKLAQKNERSKVKELQIALVPRLQAAGIVPPKS